MANPATSLSAVTATGAGTTILLTTPALNHTMQVVTTGNPTRVIVSLEGSHDGTNWFPMAVLNTQDHPVPFATSNVLAVQNVRANLLDLSGGTSPTVTATIASV